MVWKCQTGYQPDFHATSRDSRERRRREDSPWRFWSSLCGYSFTPLKELDELIAPEPPEAREAFNSLEGAYSTCHFILRKYITRQLTEEGDRLPAISAIAQAFGSHFESEYYAGLWGRFLVHDLMWENWLSNPDATKSGAPSWSWATMKGELHCDGGNTDYARAGAAPPCSAWSSATMPGPSCTATIQAVARIIQRRVPSRRGVG